MKIAVDQPLELLIRCECLTLLPESDDRGGIFQDFPWAEYRIPERWDQTDYIAFAPVEAQSGILFPIDKLAGHLDAAAIKIPNHFSPRRFFP